MSYIVMARKYRPQTFASVVGQDHIVQTLKNALAANRISHAYLFTGPRGVGKTTMARLLAKAVNCLTPAEGEPCNHCARCEEIAGGGSTDVIEIDAASNGLVDDARELREKVRYAPVSCRYKVIIIDEVHMMSNAAFNALLKTLEEPPAHTVFILATTEAHKIPATIISRCQRFDFRRIPVKEIVERLARMAAAEGLEVDDDALHAVARGADGSLRDAQSLFDQIVSFSGARITAADVVAVLGLVDVQVFARLVNAIADRDAAGALLLIDQLVTSGADLRQFMKDWVGYWRMLMVVRVLPESGDEVLQLAGAMAAEAAQQAKRFTLEELTGLAKLAAATDDELRRTQHPRLILELFLVRLASAERLVSLEALWQQLRALEARLTALPATPEAAPDEAAPAEGETGSQALAQPGAESGEPALVVDSLEEAPTTVLGRVQARWPDILQAVGQSNRRVQALLRDVAVTAADEGWVELTCSSAYHHSGLEKEEARKAVESALAGEMGRSMRMRLQLTGQAEGAPVAGEDDPASREREFSEIAQQDPLVQKTLELFGGRIVEVKKSAPGGKS